MVSKGFKPRFQTGSAPTLSIIRTQTGVLRSFPLTPTALLRRRSKVILAGQRAFGLARSSPSAVIWIKRQSPPSSAASALGCPLRCGDPKASKAFFGYITRLRFHLITRRTQVPPLDDPRRMAFFERYSDRGVRQLLLGCAQPVEPLLSKDFKSRCDALSACRLRFW